MNSSDRHRARTNVDRCRNHVSLTDANIQGWPTLISTSMTDAARENLGYFFSETAASSPDRVALIDLCKGKERTLTYGQLDERATRVASSLASLGLRPGDRLALLVGNRSGYVEIFFGAMRAGVVPVPLNVKQARSMLELMIDDAGCAAAVVDPDAGGEGREIIDRMGLGLKITFGGAAAGWIDYEEALARAAPDHAPAMSPDGIAFQPFTAGSTGRPKGVLLTHEGMLWSVRETQRHWPMSNSEIGLVAVPLFHKNAMRGTIKPVLYAGGKAVIMPQFEPRSFLETAARYRVTFTGGVPAIFAMLLRHRDLIEELDLSSLKAFAIGSAVVPQELIRSLEGVFRGVKMKESYGLTEGGGPLREPVSGRKIPRGSCGVVTEGYEVKLVAPNGNEGVSEGEMWTRSPTVTRGYHNLPQLTREKIVDGWLRTGDFFRVDADGFFYFMGRIDDMFSCGGENIYPKEVENLLFGHPAVRDACVVPIPHAVKGLVPAAAVALHPRARVTAEELKAFCLERGPAYAHPRRIVIVDDLPLSGAGKPDRKAIQRCLREPAGEART
jgi:long-chain acyl-CoA synthetase